MSLSAANLPTDYFLREIILVLKDSDGSETHTLSSICLLNKRAVYAIDWLNDFFRVQRSICDEDNREGKSIIYWGGCNINYIWLNSEINHSDGGFKWNVLEQTVTKCPLTLLVMNARAQAQPWHPRISNTGSLIFIHSCHKHVLNAHHTAPAQVPGNSHGQERKRPCSPRASELKRKESE